MRPLEALLSLIAPHTCLNCGAEGAVVCAWCREDLLAPLPSRCYKCYRSTAENKTCRRCRTKSPLSHVWVVSDYAGSAKQLIGLMKFGRNQAAAKVIAGYMADKLPLFDKEPLIVPIPTASSRVRQRGYDQAVLIAKALAKRTRLPFGRILGRMGQSRQVGATRSQRSRQLREAFYIRSDVSNRCVLLVDDVVTTGATLESAARMLKQAGAKMVMAITFTQKQ